MIKPSEKHNNRNAVNWLVYDLGDKCIKKHTNLYKGKLYDLGCGEKPYEEYFLQYVNEYIGVDWSDTLDALKADIVADLNKPLPIEDEVADTLISFSVLEHLCEPQTLLNEAYRILKKAGFKEIEVEPSSGFFTMWIMKINYFSYRFVLDDRPLPQMQPREKD